MQLFKQSRLSVTQVAKTEWETILKLAVEPVITMQTELTEVVMAQAIGLLEEAAHEAASRDIGKHHRIHLLFAG
jgi:hypothetical protein